MKAIPGTLHTVFYEVEQFILISRHHLQEDDDSVCSHQYEKAFSFP